MLHWLCHLLQSANNSGQLKLKTFDHLRRYFAQKGWMTEKKETKKPSEKQNFYNYAYKSCQINQLSTLKK
jgi:hypothetical protein